MFEFKNLLCNVSIIVFQSKISERTKMAYSVTDASEKTASARLTQTFVTLAEELS